MKRNFTQILHGDESVTEEMQGARFVNAFLLIRPNCTQLRSAAIDAIHTKSDFDMSIDKKHFKTMTIIQKFERKCGLVS